MASYNWFGLWILAEYVCRDCYRWTQRCLREMEGNDVREGT